MGRPRLGERAMAVLLRVRVTAAELSAWRRAARAAGVSLSAYVRAAVSREISRDVKK